jgi:hypothetical protein
LHAIEIVAVAEELTAETSEYKKVLTIFLDHSTALSFWEYLVVYLDGSPFVFVGLIIALYRIDVLSGGVGNSTEYVNLSFTEAA